jgi:hypothetical protein
MKNKLYQLELYPRDYEVVPVEYLINISKIRYTVYKPHLVNFRYLNFISFKINNKVFIFKRFDKFNLFGLNEEIYNIQSYRAYDKTINFHINFKNSNYSFLEIIKYGE